MIAIVDIGSNTIRLSAYEIDAGGGIVQAFSSKRFVWIAEYVNSQNILSADGVAAVCETLNGFRALIAKMDISETCAFAAASLRGIANTEEVVASIKHETGFDITVISGEEEAICGYTGATLNTPIRDGIFVDIGGGSTELVFCEEGGVVMAASIAAGALGMHSRYVDGLLPTKAQSEMIHGDTLKMLDELGVGGAFPVMCGVGGTMRALRHLHNSFFGVSSENRRADAKNVGRILELINNTPPVRAFDEITRIVPERNRVVTPGLIILNAIINKYGCEEITVSESGVREGYLMRNVIPLSRNAPLH